MNRPKTVKGYLELLKRVADMPLKNLKDYDDLSEYLKLELGAISADMYNGIQSFNESKEEACPKCGGETAWNNLNGYTWCKSEQCDWATHKEREI